MHRIVGWALIIVFVGGVFVGCSEDDLGGATDNFDRAKMLENWADNFIIPGYESYVVAVESLNTKTNQFIDNPTLENLASVRSEWLQANLSWQKVAMFEIGKAEELTLINFTNIYPTNVDDLVETITSGSYDLSSVNKQDEQGFPAIEYLIYGIRESDEAIVNLFATDAAYGSFLKDLTSRLVVLSNLVLDDWKSGYRETFISNDGSQATSSVNKLVNDYLFYYEKHLRAGKVGIPAGVFAGTTLPDKVEGLYSGSSKQLLTAGLFAMQEFFNGNGNESLKSYLEFTQEITQGEDLSKAIDVQFNTALMQVEALSDSFYNQVQTDNTAMLLVYDELQKNVVNMKVDMLQALNIRVDYIDADGD